MLKNRILAGCALLILSTSLFASDPISWSLDLAFPSSAFVAGGSYSSVYTFKNQLPFTLVNPIVINKSTNSPSEFTFNDQCTGQKLASNATCTVTVELEPTTSGSKQVQLSITGYDKNTVLLPSQVVSAVVDTNININGATVTALPASISANTSAPFQFSFTNTGTATATGVSINVNVLSYSTTCTAQLGPSASCMVTGTFTPTSTTPTSQAVTATFSYNQGSPVTVSTSTNVTAATGVTGVVTQGLPGIAVAGQNYDFIFTFTNNENTPVNVTQTNSFSNVTSLNNGCPDPGAMAPNQVCTITGTFNSSSTGNFTLSSDWVVSGFSNVSLSTSTDVTSSSSSRQITLVNNCNFPVWFSLNGANRQNNGNDIPCTSNAQCPPGSQCNPSANGGTGLCFWENYAPSNGSYQLAASNGTNTVIIPEPTVASTIFWSGNISASTGCSGSTCVTAQCNNNGGTTSCAPGVGFQQPATQAELTLLTGNAQDTYDIEVINGFHIPIQVTPDGASPSGYTCGSPGQSTAGNGFGACNWVQSPPATTYYWVTSGGPSCGTSTTPSCTGGTVCGLDIGVNRVCGKFLGLWTANQACAVNQTNANQYFNCNQTLVSPYPTNTYHLTDLYGCKVPNSANPLLNSCYSASANNTCCGCANWQNISGITLPASTQLCVSSSQQWVSFVQPGLQWMKQSCPSSYVYPFDDESSTFKCQAGNPNLQNYTITFCAGGGTGKPFSIQEGRAG